MRSALIGLGCLALLISGHATADTSEAGSGTSAPTSQSAASGATSSQVAGTTLEEVTVTATRRSESVEKVPISIEALTQAELTEGGIKYIDDLAAVTPGLQFATPNGFASTITTVSIRGVNSNTGPSAVGIYLDDTPLQARLSFIGNAGNPFPIIFDLDRVEVARGPQGTLFGAGSEAGTVRFITNEPSLTEFSGYSHAELSMTQNGAPSYEIGSAAGGPIIQNELGFRVAAWTREDGGYIDLYDPITNSVTTPNVNKDTKSVLRAALTAAIGDVRVTTSFHYQSIKNDDSGFFFGNFFSEPSQGYFLDGTLKPQISNDYFWVPEIKIETPLSFADLTSTTSYLYRNIAVNMDASTQFAPILSSVNGIPGGYGSPLAQSIVTSPNDSAPTYTLTTQKLIDQEVRLASNNKDAFISWVAGVFYEHEVQLDVDQTSQLAMDPTGALVYNANQTHTDEQIAAYAQADIHFTPELTATLGERVARTKVNYLEITGPGILDVGVPPISTASVTETPSTPRVALSYQADSRNLFYLAVSKGFRVGGGNELLPTYCNYDAPLTYKSDSLWSYELGAKNKLFDDRLQLDSSIFYIKWSDIQQQVFVPCGLGYNANTGGAASKGFDVAVHAAATERLRLDLDVAYADAYFTNNFNDPAGNPIVLSGDKIGLTPQVNAPWNVSSSANYQIPLSNNDSIRFRIAYLYNSRNPGPFITQIPTSPTYFPQNVPDPPTHLTNGRIDYTRGKVDLSLFVNNVFNSHPLLASWSYPPAPNLVTNTTFRPRTLGVSANVRF
jgi:iron complex outermembrane recepter protein